MKHRTSSFSLRRREHNDSEVRLGRDGDLVIEQMLVVLGTDLLGHRSLHPIVMLDPRPKLIIGVRILYPNVRFQFVAAADQSPALDDVEFFGMWGPVISTK